MKHFILIALMAATFANIDYTNGRTMAEADISMGWVDGDQSYLQRRHSVSLSQRFPVFDEDLSHDLVHSEQIDGITRIQFIREMYPCADEEVFLSFYICYTFCIALCF